MLTGEQRGFLGRVFFGFQKKSFQAAKVSRKVSRTSLGYFELKKKRVRKEIPLTKAMCRFESSLQLISGIRQELVGVFVQKQKGLVVDETLFT